jgi:hypothetical protein
LNEIINVTSYVVSCSINTTSTGGSFSLVLPSFAGDANIYKSGSALYSDAVLSANTGEFFFHKYIQSNDIVFIKFEKLDLEGDFIQRISMSEDFIIDKSLLANQVYDMIGLVDTNNKTMSYESNDYMVSIEGRDMMKMLIDDGSYFMPLVFLKDSQSLFVNLQDDDKILQRVFTTGSYPSLFAFSLRNIPDTVQFVINQLANVGVVDESIDLFSSYGMRRTRVYRLQTDTTDTFVDKLHMGVWQIIKLLVDSNITDRLIADSSISQPDGSLISQMQKFCQEPFVEFFGDTYGDTYNLIIRQPPYTESCVLSVLNNNVDDRSFVKDSTQMITKSSLTSEQQDIILTIDPEDVLQENIGFENQSQFYSWYEITPQGSFIGSADKLALAFVPIVYLPQYANKWGLRKMSVVTNYMSNRALTGKSSAFNQDLLKEAVMNDFKLLIDSYCYLPFTRRGTLILNGDRRFKRGTWVRYDKEIFYVDSVSNEYSIAGGSIERTTTLNLNRGMVEKYIKNSYSYFKIVDTKMIKDVLIEQLTVNSSNEAYLSSGLKSGASLGITKGVPRTNIKSNFGVNQEQFDFFYSRKQFE